MGSIITETDFVNQRRVRDMDDRSFANFTWFMNFELSFFQHDLDAHAAAMNDPFFVAMRKEAQRRERLNISKPPPSHEERMELRRLRLQGCEVIPFPIYRRS